MGAQTRHSRTASLSRCTSFLSCFNGGDQESYEPIMALSGQRKQQQQLPTMQLGTKAPKRSFSFSLWACAGSKMKEACEQALEAAKKGSPHISDLFVGGGQLFLHVGPHKSLKQHSVSPSIGFLHLATTMESSPQDR